MNPDINLSTGASFADQAACRNRKVAACAIAARLRHLAGQECFWTQSPTGPKAGLVVGDVFVCFWLNDSGLYFRVDDIAGGPPLMSGYIDPERGGTYDQGHLSIASWRRGWERQLFGPISVVSRAFGIWAASTTARSALDRPQ